MSSEDAPDPTLARAEARVGQYLREKWRLDHVLGVGGAAAVYSATHRNGSRAAVKVLHLEFSLDADIRQRFLREGYLANAVEHPSVVRVIDDDVAEDGSVFLVMELLTGETMEDRMQRAGGRLPADEVLAALDPILSALSAAHAKGIVHRDIKPENLFIDQDGTVRLLDFGIARLREASGSATMSGSMLGTPAYMPPEQALGHSEDTGPRSDVWAVGATMYTLLSGKFVHEGRNANEQLIHAATRGAPLLATVAPFINDEVASVIDRALQFEPADRWESAEAMQAALREAYHSLTSSSVETAPRLAVPERRASFPERQPSPKSARGTTGPAGVHAFSVAPPQRRRSTLLVAGAGALVLLVLIGTATLFRKRAAPPPTNTTTNTATDVASDSSAPIVAPPAASSAAPDSSASPSTESIDALPTAVAVVPSSGSVRIIVLGGTCVLAIDGKTSPTPSVQVPAGDHVVTCKPDGERTQKQGVHVKEGEERTVTFALSKKGPRSRRQ